MRPKPFGYQMPWWFSKFQKIIQIVREQETDLPQQGSLLPAPTPLFPPKVCGQGWDGSGRRKETILAMAGGGVEKLLSQWSPAVYSNWIIGVIKELHSLFQLQ